MGHHSSDDGSDDDGGGSDDHHDQHEHAHEQLRAEKSLAKNDKEDDADRLLPVEPYSYTVMTAEEEAAEEKRRRNAAMRAARIPNTAAW